MNMLEMLSLLFPTHFKLNMIMISASYLIQSVNKTETERVSRQTKNQIQLSSINMKAISIKCEIKWFFNQVKLFSCFYYVPLDFLWVTRTSPKTTHQEQRWPSVWCHSFRLVRPADGRMLSNLWGRCLTSDPSLMLKQQLATCVVLLYGRFWEEHKLSSFWRDSPWKAFSYLFDYFHKSVSLCCTYCIKLNCFILFLDYWVINVMPVFVL